MSHVKDEQNAQKFGSKLSGFCFLGVIVEDTYSGSNSLLDIPETKTETITSSSFIVKPPESDIYGIGESIF